jgi:hypothetical protein
MIRKRERKGVLPNSFPELGRASVAGLIIRRLSTAWSLYERSAVDWPLEGLLNGDRVVEGSLAGGAASGIVVRSSACFRSLGGLSVVG